jgi:hypothetical protein
MHKANQGLVNEASLFENTLMGMMFLVFNPLSALILFFQV